MSGFNLNIQTGSGAKAKISTIGLNADTALVSELKKAYAKVCKKDVNRMSFKKEVSGENVVRLDDDRKSLKHYGVVSGDTIIFKDLGPQIGYRTVFVVEYAGPLFIMLLYALRPALIFGEGAASKPWDTVAKLGLSCWALHFLKREFETFFVHKFSRPTMPLNNLFKNCAYYWTFAAVIGIPLCSPNYVAPSNMTMVYAGLALFLLSQVGNLICHVMLRNLRPAEGSTERPIPTGFLFELVSCPNYTFEILAWVGFSIMTQIPFAYAFTLVGALQMGDWAQKKHQGYIKASDKYKGLKRKAIVPFIY